MPHTIRLRGFWETATDGTRTNHTRKFGRPRTLDAGERVWLVCSALPGTTVAFVNGQVVGETTESGPFAADITDLLQNRNEVRFAVASDVPPGDVSVEIRAGTS